MDDLTGKVDSAGPPTGVLTADEWNQLAQELLGIIQTWGGMTPTDADTDQIGKGLAVAVSAFDFFSCSGAANTYTANPIARPGPTILSNGMRARFIPSANNTGASTVNVSSLGVKNIKRPDGTALQAGDISTSRVLEIYYNSGAGEFRMTPGSLPASSAAFFPGFISGLVFTPPSADLTHDLTFQAGQCRDATNAGNLVLAAALTKRFDGASIALGTGQTGFPTASLTRAASTWYRVFIVGHTDGRVDFGFDTSATAANLRADLVSIDAAGWSYYRQLGWVRTQSGDANAFVPFVQYAAEPGLFQWVEQNIVVDADAALVTARTARSLASLVPPGAVAHVLVAMQDSSGSGTVNRYGFITDKNQADYTPSATAHNVASKTSPGAFGNGWTPATEVRVEVDASSEVFERWNAAGSIQRTLLVPRFSFAR